MKYHIDRFGKKTPIKDLTTEHLENIIKLIERRARDGLMMESSGGCSADEIWWDEYLIFGEDVKEYMDYDDYMAELKRRNEKEMRKQKNVIKL